MYAVIASGGKQYRVQAGDVVRVEKLDAEPGKELAFDALFIGGDGKAQVGTPIIDGAKVKAVVKRDGKNRKLWSFKKFEGPAARIRGHRQQFTEIEITGIEA